MTASTESLTAFPLLADLHGDRGYRACALNLNTHEQQRTYWIDLFRSHLVLMVDEIKRQYADDPQVDQRAATVADHFTQYLDQLSQTPQRDERLEIITICHARESALRAGGIDDAYCDTKSRENETAMKVLPALLHQLDSTADQPRQLIEGIFAGNIFDLGATCTAELFDDGQSVDFHAVRAKLKPRPWLFDDLDLWLSRWHTKPHRSSVLFVDNAGCDIVLGMIPFARQLLKRGTDVLLTANSTPTLNDVTYDELKELIRRIGALDATIAQALESGRLELVASGNGVPLIDLSQVSSALAEAVLRRKVDLVVLEGMGRAVETNLDARFTCDTLKIAMIKDQGVAEHLNGQLYDLVFRYEPLAAPRLPSPLDR